MLRCCRNNALAWLSLWIAAANVHATSSIKDGDVVITLRNGNPCFSYPLDEATKKRNYSFELLGVSLNDREASLPGVKAWELGFSKADEKNLANPNSPETCIEYGVDYPGTKQKAPAALIRFDVPYRVFLHVSTDTGAFYERKYLSEFCISHNATGDRIILEAKYNNATNKYECIK